MRSYYVYIVASHNNMVVYIGVTNNLERRVQEHRLRLIEGFTRQYYCHRLVYYEETSSIDAAIAREKELKGWRRSKKDALIESTNPNWIDLSHNWNI